MDFLNNLNSLLSRRGISRNKFCSDVGINKNAIVNWENRGNTPDGKTLAKIADYFNITVDELIGKAGDSVPNKSAAERLGDAVIEALIRAGKIDKNEPITPELVDSIARVIYTVASFKA